MCEILAHARHVKLFPHACSDASQEGLGWVWAGGAWEEMFVTETPLSQLPFLLSITPQFPVQITLFLSSHLKPSGDTKCSQSIQSQFRLLSWLLLTVLVFSCNSVYCVCVCVYLPLHHPSHCAWCFFHCSVGRLSVLSLSIYFKPDVLSTQNAFLIHL